MQYERVPLGVEAVFYADGTIIPRKVSFETKKYMIDRVVGCRPRNPGTVSCIAPIEYVVMIEGLTKKIYFEPETRRWFSVKERR